jgi:hypothetical protein
MIDSAIIQRYWARSSVSASTVRGQPCGTKGKAICYLIKMNLADFSKILNVKQFQHILNEKTIELEKIIPSHNWGISRKILNIFLIKASQDKYLSKKHNLDTLLHYLEVPLDNSNAKKIREHAREKGEKLPTWKSISKLKRETSDEYQSYSNQIAKEKGCERYQLDFLWWNQPHARDGMK